MNVFIFSCFSFLFLILESNAQQISTPTPRTNSPAYHGRHYREFKYIPPKPITPYSANPIYPVLPVRPFLPSYAPRDYYGYPYGRYYYSNPNIMQGLRSNGR